MSQLLSLVLSLCAFFSGGVDHPQGSEQAALDAASHALAQPPVSQGLVIGSVVGSTLTATMYDSGGGPVGTITLNLGGAIVSGQTTGTSLGDSTFFRGYGRYSGSAGSVFGAARYAVPGFHVFELKWDASGSVLGGWTQY